jgi:hypothetical protein
MQPRHKFASFVDESKLDTVALWQHAEYLDCPGVDVLTKAGTSQCYEFWGWLCANPAPKALHVLRAYSERINQYMLARNTSSEAGPLLEVNAAKIYWELSKNAAPHAVQLLELFPHHIDWWGLSSNSAPKAVKWLLENPTKIELVPLSWNTSPDTIKWLRAHPDKIYWPGLSSNSSPDAIALLMENTEHIRWTHLCRNSAPEAVALLAANPDNIVWDELSANTSPHAIDLLLTQPRSICWFTMSRNPRIFALDHAKMSEQMRPLREELLRHCMHPSRLHQAEHHWLLV